MDLLDKANIIRLNTNNEPMAAIPEQNKEHITNDIVNSPAHYNRGKYEVIDIIEDVLTLSQDKIEMFGPRALYIGSLWGNVLKYMCRWPDKGGITDLKKARWYLNKIIDALDVKGE